MVRKSLYANSSDFSSSLFEPTASPFSFIMFLLKMLLGLLVSRLWPDELLIIELSFGELTDESY